MTKFSQFNNHLQKIDPSHVCELYNKVEFKQTESNKLINDHETENINDIFEVDRNISHYEELLKLNTENILKYENDKKCISLGKEENEFIAKYNIEKKSIIDSIDEKSLTSLVYKKGFRFDYQMKIFKLILQSMFETNINEKIEDKLKNYGGDSINVEDMNRRIFYIEHEETFAIFKKIYKDGKTFKNQLLKNDKWKFSCDNIYIKDTNPPEVDDNGNVLKPIPLLKRATIFNNKLSKVNLDDIKITREALNDLRNEAIKYEGENDHETIFIPFLNLLNIILNHTPYKNTVNNIQSQISEVMFYN